MPSAARFLPPMQPQTEVRRQRKGAQHECLLNSVGSPVAKISFFAINQIFEHLLYLTCPICVLEYKVQSKFIEIARDSRLYSELKYLGRIG